MAWRLNSLYARVVLATLAVHAILVPALLNGLLYVTRQSHEEIFVNHARSYGRILADTLELDGALDSESRVIGLLDSVMLSSDGIYAALRDGDRYLLSSLVPVEARNSYREDFAFGTHGDRTYYLSVPLHVPGHDAVLRLGLDEQPTMDAIATARGQIVGVLTIYVIVSVALVLLLSRLLTRPLETLREASRKIASGSFGKRLDVRTHLLEISELAQDLERMRSELVGVNLRLQHEMAERAAAEDDRKQLEAQLQRAQRIETVGTLAGGVAHEFNNILLPIILFAESTLEDLPSDSRAAESISRVLKSAHRAKSVVQQILAFAHQTEPEERRPIRLGPIIEEVLSFLGALVPASVHIQRSLEGSDGTVLGDAGQLHQLITNVCNNAAQALGSGGGTLRIELEDIEVDQQLARRHPDLRSGAHVRLSISDTGHGIDAATLERIFEPFFTTRNVGEGTGLGLSVALGIAKSHGGTITVDSEPGKGSTFHLYLPRAGVRVVETLAEAGRPLAGSRVG